MTEPGRSEFLAAATALRRNRSFLEARKKEIEGDLMAFKGAEEALIVLAEADRLQKEIQDRIAWATAKCEEAQKDAHAATANLNRTLSSCEAEIKAVRDATEKTLRAESDAKAAAESRIKAIADNVETVRRAADAKIAEINAQVEERAAALTAIKEQIARLHGA